MTKLQEYNKLQKRILDVDHSSEEHDKIADRLDVLWIDLSSEEVEKSHEYSRSLMTERGQV